MPKATGKIDIFSSSKFNLTKKFNNEKHFAFYLVSKNTILDMKLHSIISASIKSAI